MRQALIRPIAAHDTSLLACQQCKRVGSDIELPILLGAVAGN